ncbi:hypothetical protein GGE16_000114 [Rhizobium leguminosarum]|uniref:PRTase-CE domain-containing protein n=2 Tax=Rhizobium/Agrobacterium group TaxID=227290 RepID=A0AAE2MF16_RHILE|nr:MULTISPECIES: hypothetical protein [Rhizobium]MBB4288098.1 hypothetical protein [Rhizobium leguminosarum]MBB4417214.1 hypothetical protein [Rhizobium leguminosarum]
MELHSPVDFLEAKIPERIMDISLEQLNEIDEIILQKGWNDLINNKGDMINSITFELFERVNDHEEFELLKSLIRRYFLCTEYDQYCFKIAKHIEGLFYDEAIIIIPVSDKDRKIKSGHAVSYDLTRFLDDDKFSEMLILESLESVGDRIADFNIIVVDDFVGSGSQFRAFVKKCAASYGLQAANVYLYSIAMMAKARERISDFCYAAIPMVELSRSLSDPSDLGQAIDPLQVYGRIEGRADVGRNFRRGFLRSEALVTMKKTPNNTLPIFWCKHDQNGKLWPAIFPRG